MTFLRRKWQQKPKQWGPISVVQSALRDNLERIGIDYSKMRLGLPIWERVGQPIDYSRHNKKNSLNSPLSWENDYIVPTINNVVLDNTIVYENTDAYTVLFTASGVVFRAYSFYGNAAASYFRSGYYWKWYCGNDVTLTTEVTSFEEKRTYAATANGDMNLKAYINGGCVFDDTKYTKIDISTIGSHQTISGTENLHSFLVFDYELSQQQIASLSAQPGSIWQPVPRTTYFIPSGETILPIIGTLGATVDASANLAGKIGVGGGLVASSGAATLDNQGQEGKQGPINSQLNPLIGLLDGSLGISGGFSSILSQSAMLLAGKQGNKGTFTGQISLSAQLFGSTDGGGPQVVVEGSLSSVAGALEADISGQTGTTGALAAQVIAAASLAGQIGASGSYTMQLDGVSAMLEAALGVSGEISTSVSAGADMAGKIGVAGDVLAALEDLGLQLVEIVKSERIYQIILSTKTGQVLFLAPKTATIDISTST